MRVRVTILVIALLAVQLASAATFEPKWGRNGMVVTSVGPAAAAGQKILEKGGNAVDAAVACIVKKAADRAKANGRKTVRDCDV